MKLIPEHQAAEKIGVPRDELARLRVEHLVEGDDWKSRGREICLTSAGVKKVVEILRPRKENAPQKAPDLESGGAASVSDGSEAGVCIPQPVLDDPGAKKERAEVLRAGVRKPEMLRVVRKCQNPRLLLAVRLDTMAVPAEIRVRVRDAKPFAIGMEFPAFRERDDFYVFEGKPPRNGRMR